MCLTLWDLTDCSMPGLLFPHHLPKFAQVHVHCIGDPIQPSHPLTPSSPALNLSQHQRLFQWVVCSHQMTTMPELQLQHQSFQQIFRVVFLKIGLISLLSKGLSGVFSSLKASPLWHSACSTAQLSQPYVTTRKTTALTITDLCRQSNVSVFQHTVYVCHHFPAKKQLSSDFMAAGTTCSDFVA